MSSHSSSPSGHWWMNVGHHKAMEIRNTKTRRSRRTMSMFTVFFLIWGATWIIGIVYYTLTSPLFNSVVYDSVDVGDASCSFSTAKEGYLESCLDPCTGFRSLPEAKQKCLFDAECIGITYVPWEPYNKKYVLRKQWSHNATVVATTDGQLSYVKRCLQKNDIELEKEDSKTIPEKTPLKVTDKKPASQNTVNNKNQYATVFIGLVLESHEQCTAVLANALARASYASRLRFGVVIQSSPKDSKCGIEKCALDSSAAVCPFKDHVHFEHVENGKISSSILMNRMFGGEDYAMRVVGPVEFADRWDERLIRQFLETENANAILTTSAASLKQTSGKTQTTKVSCTNTIQAGNRSPQRYATEDLSTVLSQPLLQIWLQSQAIFAPGSYITKTYNSDLSDRCGMELVLDEFLMIETIRAWTHGFDVYAMTESLFSQSSPTAYQTLGEAMFLRQSNEESKEKSLNILEKCLANDVEQTSWCNFGRTRGLPKFLAMFALASGYEKNLCPAVKRMDFHKALVPYLKLTGNQRIKYDSVNDKLDFLKASKRAEKGLGEYAAFVDV